VSGNGVSCGWRGLRRTLAGPILSRLFFAGCCRAVPAGLALVAAGGAALTQAATIIDGTTGSNTDSTAYSTTGNLDISLGFVAEYLIVGGGLRNWHGDGTITVQQTLTPSVGMEKA
jgi:hypothetical protein